MSPLADHQFIVRSSSRMVADCLRRSKAILIPSSAVRQQILSRETGGAHVCLLGRFRARELRDRLDFLGENEKEG
jgi:hypothetical protein